MEREPRQPENRELSLAWGRKLKDELWRVMDLAASEQEFDPRNLAPYEISSREEEYIAQADSKTFWLEDGRLVMLSRQIGDASALLKGEYSRNYVMAMFPMGKDDQGEHKLERWFTVFLDEVSSRIGFVDRRIKPAKKYKERGIRELIDSVPLSAMSSELLDDMPQEDIENKNDMLNTREFGKIMRTLRSVEFKHLV